MERICLNFVQKCTENNELQQSDVSFKDVKATSKSCFTLNQNKK